MHLELISCVPFHPVIIAPSANALLKDATSSLALFRPQQGDPAVEVAVAGSDAQAWAGLQLVGRSEIGEICLIGELRAASDGQMKAAMYLTSERMDETSLRQGAIGWTVESPIGEPVAKGPTQTNLLILPSDVAVLFPRGLSASVLLDLSEAASCGEREASAFTPLTVAELAQRVFQQNPPRYDRDNGAYHYITINSAWDDLTFHERRYNDARNNARALINCYDCAAYLQVLLRAAGYAVRFCFLSPFGYLRQTPLIGRGACNNPFVGGNAALIVPRNSRDRSAFGNHAFCEVTVGTSKFIADACAGPHGGTEDRAAYVAAATDDQTPVPPTITRGRAQDITDYRGVVAVNSLSRLSPQSEPIMPEKLPQAITGTVLAPQAEAFAAAVGFTNGVQPLINQPIFVPEPVALLADAGFRLAFSDLAVGYPESNRYFRFERDETNLTLTIHVSSIGSARAQERFLALGAGYQSPEPPYVPGPPSLGEASAASTGSENSRLFWVQSNTVFDLHSDGPVDLIPLAERIAAAAIPADRPAPPQAPAATPDFHVGEEALVAIDAPADALMDFALGEPGLAFSGQVEEGLRFTGLAPGLVRLAITLADPFTLLASQQTLAVTVTPRRVAD